MTRDNLLSYFLYFIAFTLLQAIFFRNFILFNTAFCFIYVAFILLLPLETGPILLMLLGFIMGVTIDIFYSSLGLHAAACVLIAYLRPHWISMLTPKGGYEAGAQLSLGSMGFSWFLTYSFALIFIHHFALFYIEANGFQFFFFTFSKVFFSSLLTMTVVMIFLSLMRR